MNASNTSCKNRQGTAKTYAHMLQILMFRNQAQVRVKAMIVAAIGRLHLSESTDYESRAIKPIFTDLGLSCQQKIAQNWANIFDALAMGKVLFE